MIPALSEFTQPIRPALYPAYTIFTVLSAAVLAVFAGYAVRRWFTDRDGVPAMFLVGGAVASLFEPLLDVNGGVWYPETGGIAYLTLLGVRLPLFVLTSYIWIIGGQAYLCWRAFDQRWPLPRMLKLIAFVAVTDVVTEFIGVGMGAYGYYGNQPFQVLGFPLWYPAVNTVAPPFGGAAYHLLRPYLRGPRSVLGPLMVVIGISGGYSVCGWPLWTGLQAEASLPVMYLLCIPVAVLTFVAVLLVLVVTRTPGLTPGPDAEAAVAGARRQPLARSH
jgi:hypothetical protein